MDDRLHEGLRDAETTRPIAVNENGERMHGSLGDSDMCFSNMTREDFEVYLRGRQYSECVNRDLTKFYYEAKWVHYSHRFELLERVHSRLNAIRLTHEKDWMTYFHSIFSPITQIVSTKYPAS